ncbi:MAG: 16S rRNA (uracil(1498)-N(3))-methyltransferase [Ktedonobacteraceae bacterium]|nr:16S rRNA (uracil(1498)-N(3))-methyltransferase [Ktedonobacteraceae bacterium]
MHRFFVAPELLAHTGPTSTVILPEKLAHQVRDVLHLAIGEQLILLDNSGDEFVCTVAKSGRMGVEVEMRERKVGKTEPSIRVILCQALLKSARFEWVLEKGTELGVAVFVPTLCQRSMPGLKDAGPVKIQRWQHIVREAAEQCDRSRLPELSPICPLVQALNDIPSQALALVAWEKEQRRSLRNVLRSATSITGGTKPTTVVLFIGPEGGLTAEEVMLAQQRGIQVVTLGSRILRAETAAIIAVANILYELA